MSTHEAEAASEENWSLKAEAQRQEVLVHTRELTCLYHPPLLQQHQNLDTDHQVTSHACPEFPVL